MSHEHTIQFTLPQSGEWGARLKVLTDSKDKRKSDGVLVKRLRPGTTVSKILCEGDVLIQLDKTSLVGLKPIDCKRFVQREVAKVKEVQVRRRVARQVSGALKALAQGQEDDNNSAPSSSSTSSKKPTTKRTLPKSPPSAVVSQTPSSSAKKKLKPSPAGTRQPGPNAVSTSVDSKDVDHPKSLVQPSDRSTVSDFLYQLMKQFWPHNESNSATRQGLICRYCLSHSTAEHPNEHNTTTFKPSHTPYSLSFTSSRGLKSCFKGSINHIRSCKYCPRAVKEELGQLEKLQTVQWTKLKSDAEVNFFEMIWGRILESSSTSE